MADILLKNAVGEDVTYQGINVLQVRNTEEGTTSFVDQALLGNIPTKVSQLENDSNYTTEELVDEKIAAISGSGAANADYEQNDSTATDYIKNRPFYDNSTIQEVFPLTQLTFNPTWGWPWSAVQDLSEEQAEVLRQTSTSIIIEYDGKVYERDLALENIGEGLVWRFYGNVGLFESAFAPTDDSFAIGFVIDDGANQTSQLMVRDIGTLLNETALTKSLRISIRVGEIKQIDNSFIGKIDYENQVTNKPFGRTVENYTVNAQTLQEVYCGNEDVGIYQLVSSHTPNPENIIGGKVNSVYPDGTLESAIVASNDIVFSSSEVCVIMLSNALLVIAYCSGTINITGVITATVVIPQTGMYVSSDVAQALQSGVSITWTSESTKRSNPEVTSAYWQNIPNRPFGTWGQGDLIAKGRVECAELNVDEYVGYSNFVPLVENTEYIVDFDGIRYYAVAEKVGAGATMIQIDNSKITSVESGVGCFTQFGSTEGLHYYSIIANGTITKKIGSYWLSEQTTILPEVAESDNGKFLQVVNGGWAAVALTDVS